MMGQNAERGKPFIHYPTNKLFAVFNEPQDVQVAHEALANIGISANAVTIFCGKEGIRRIDALGREHNLRTRIIRTVQQLGQEGKDVKQYECELKSGHYLLCVFTPEDSLKTKVISVLKTHGAHHINFYGVLSTEIF